eukprot:TRINITY_DN6925_c0_g1_i1.p1 TRINITY_DN6925_c0_g1~~TRINITY_DN6925_c0_g1_i1.p1  ORF type:complete len:734 (-),score=196.01 TRINITY_DN6925_c0_g1_i1:99-2300(-)
MSSTKITIKQFKNPIQVNPNYPDETWQLIRGAIHEIHRKNASGLSFEELYRNAYNMVLHKYGDMLYRGLRSEVHDHLCNVAHHVASSNDQSFLIELKSAWEEHKTSMTVIRDILLYMDRVYVQRHQVPTVYDLGLILFRENVARADKIRGRLRDTLLDNIERERNGEVIDRRLVKSVTQMLVDVGVNSRAIYEEDFEKPFLDSSAEFYRGEAQRFIGENSCSEYLKKVEARLREEAERVLYYLDSSTGPLIRGVVERQLISDHINDLIDMENSGLVSMLKDDMVSDLSRLYSLFSRVPDALMAARESLNQYVRNTGKAIVTDTEVTKGNSSTFVPQLLALKEKYDRILKQSFGDDKIFQECINRAFEYFINHNPRCPEYISLFIDDNLKRGLKTATEEEVDSKLDKVMMLFRYIQEKDMFEKYYKQHLAKRLLFGKSVSDDAERTMIGKLKTECGYQFTSKLEGMFNDMRLSADTMDRFKEHLVNTPISLNGVDLNVQVLTTIFWPTQTAKNCHLPPEIIHCCEAFKQFYLGAHNGRRLTWQTNMGTAEVKATFDGKLKELIVSTYQMCILLLFNAGDTLSFKELKENTGIPVQDLQRNLLSLSCGKQRLLLKQPRTKQFADTDTFSFNGNFKSNYYRVKIMTVSVKESEPERVETRQKVDEDRKHQIEAAIVRVMKSRTRMEHSQLIAEVSAQLSSRFRPNPNIIKKRIESLIEREYLERSSANRKIYQYLA